MCKFLTLSLTHKLQWSPKIRECLVAISRVGVGFRMNRKLVFTSIMLCLVLFQFNYNFNLSHQIYQKLNNHNMTQSLYCIVYCIDSDNAFSESGPKTWCSTICKYTKKKKKVQATNLHSTSSESYSENPFLRTQNYSYFEVLKEFINWKVDKKQ